MDPRGKQARLPGFDWATMPFLDPTERSLHDATVLDLAKRQLGPVVAEVPSANSGPNKERRGAGVVVAKTTNQERGSLALAPS